MTRIVTAHRLHSGMPAEWAAQGLGLVTLDLDRVLAAPGSPVVFDESPGLVDEMRNQGLTPVVATNSNHTDTFPGISGQLGGISINHAVQPGMRRKPHPAMLRAATKETGIPPDRAVHVDDQLKAYIAARLAGFALFVWVRPRGGNILRDHPGTLALRALELPIFLGLMGLQALSRK